MWDVILIASVLALALKLVGFLVPATALDRPTASRVAELITVALLAGLVAVQTFGAGQAVVLDARLPAVLAAAGLFALRVPFVLVVIAAALVAALLRLLGWMA